MAGRPIEGLYRCPSCRNELKLKGGKHKLSDELTVRYAQCNTCTDNINKKIFEDSSTLDKGLITIEIIDRRK